MGDIGIRAVHEHTLGAISSSSGGPVSLNRDLGLDENVEYLIGTHDFALDTYTLLESQERLGNCIVVISNIPNLGVEVIRVISASQSNSNSLREFESSAPASAGGTDRDLAATQFPRNCVPYNIIEFKHYKFKII